MAALEGEWRRREKAREAELAAMRAEYDAVEEKTRRVGCVYLLSMYVLCMHLLCTYAGMYLIVGR